MIIYLEILDSDADRDKFTAIYYKYRSLMYSVALKILRNPADAEDAVHNAFMYIAENFSKFSSLSAPKLASQIVILTKWRAKDILKERSRATELGAKDEFPAEEIQVSGELSEALARLPSEQRDIILLRYSYGYSVKEIAKMMGTTPDAIYKRINKTKILLAGELEKEGKE